jgi:uncharacterized protein YcfL
MRKLYLIVLVVLALAGCKKQSSAPFDNDPVKTQTLKYLTQTPWKQTALEYQNSAGAWIAKSLSAVQLSYVYNFTTTGDDSGTFTIYNGNTLNSTGTWLIIGDNTQIVFNANGTTYNFGTLNDTAMQLVLTGQIPYTDPSTNAVTTYYGMRETFGH